MQEINLLRQMLQQHLRWNAARVTFVAIFLIALIRVRTVNLAEIATGFSSNAKLESRYKRLQGFFRDFTVDYETIALMVVKVLTADREFVGKDWFAYLLSDPCTRFRIRIRKNTLLGDGQKQLRADVCCQDLQVGESKVLSKPRLVWGHALYLAAMGLEDGDLLIVATADEPDTAITNYGKHWARETLCGYL